MARRLDKSLCVGFDLANSDGVTVLRSYQTDSREENWASVRIGRNRWRCKIPRGLLNGGNYLVNPRISIHNLAWIVHEDAILEFRRQFKARRIAPVEFDIGKKSPRINRPCSRLDFGELMSPGSQAASPNQSIRLVASSLNDEFGNLAKRLVFLSSRRVPHADLLAVKNCEFVNERVRGSC